MICCKEYPVNVILNEIINGTLYANKSTLNKGMKKYTFYSFLNHITEIIEYINVKQSHDFMNLLHEFYKNEKEKYNWIEIYRKIGSSLYNKIYYGNNILSIIIPVYNNKQYIEKCLDSILSQSIKNIEIICVDDGSTDSSAVVINRYASKYPFIKVITQVNAGPGAARNRALEIASGEFITFIDSDDYLYYPDYVFDCLDYMIRENDVDIVVTPPLREKNRQLKRNKIEKIEKCSGLEAAQLYLSRKFSTHASWAKFYRKKVIGDTKFVEFGFSEDNLFCLNVMTRAKSVSALEYYGYVYFNDNVSSLRPNKITEYHVLSSLRLLLEILNWKYNSKLVTDKVDIHRFVSIWNREHGKKITTYINKGKENNAIHLFFNKIHNAKPILLKFIDSNFIKSYINSITEQSVQDVEIEKYDSLFRYISWIDV